MVAAIIAPAGLAANIIPIISSDTSCYFANVGKNGYNSDKAKAHKHYPIINIKKMTSLSIFKFK